MSSKSYRVPPNADISDIDLNEEEFTLPDGSRLTEERAAAIAAATEQRLTNLVPGRKSLSGGTRHSPVLQVRLPESTREELAARAEEQGVPVSKIARDLIERGLRAS